MYILVVSITKHVSKTLWSKLSERHWAGSHKINYTKAVHSRKYTGVCETYTCIETNHQQQKKHLKEFKERTNTEAQYTKWASCVSHYNLKKMSTVTPSRCHSDDIARIHTIVMHHQLSCVIQTGRRGCLAVALYVITGRSADGCSRLYDPGEGWQQAQCVCVWREQLSYANDPEALWKRNVLQRKSAILFIYLF